MKYLILLCLTLSVCLIGEAQTEKQKNKFAERIFSDFKKNRLDKVTDLFIDSVMLDQLIAKSIEAGEPLTTKYNREEIHAQSKKAKAQLFASLEKAYERFNAKGVEEKFHQVKPSYKFKEKQKTPIKTFDIQYRFLLDDYDADFTMPLVMFDNGRQRFYLLSRRVRAHVVDTDAKIAVVRETDRNIISDEEVELDVPPPPAPPAPPPPKRIIEERELVDIEVEEPEFVAKEEVFQIVETMPEYPGGEKEMYKYIIKNLRYPEIARENNVQGKVYVSFIVSKDGSLREVKVLRGIGYGCDEEAMRVILRMPRWKPGTQRGKPVAVRYTLPFNFKLK